LFNVGKVAPKPSFPPENETERLRHEFSALGFLCDRHPMVLYADVLKKQKIVKARNLSRFTGRHVHLAGLLITGKVVHTKHVSKMKPAWWKLFFSPKPIADFAPFWIEAALSYFMVK